LNLFAQLTRTAQTRGFWTILLFLALGLSQPFLVHAEEDDPGLIRALGTDSASVENAYYLWAYIDNAPSQGLYLYGQGDFALTKDWGLVASFPNLDTLLPLGRTALVMGPMGLSVRYEAWRSGGWATETAGVFSIQGGAALGFSNPTFPYVGSSWALTALGGYRIGKLFIQGNYGYEGGIDPQVPSQWKAHTSLGLNLGADWYIQGEADFYTVTSPLSDSDWSFIPQFAYQPGDWLFELGQAFSGNPGVTEILVARTF
jgi:hypothetical protein